MWRKRKNGSAPVQAATSMIDHGCEFEGNLTFVGTLVVNGKFRGELRSSDTLIVGETGELQADAHIGTVISAGQVSGSIVAIERVELRRTARIFGKISTAVLVVEEGANFDGQCRMNRKEPQVLQMNREEPDADNRSQII